MVHSTHYTHTQSMYLRAYVENSSELVERLISRRYNIPANIQSKITQANNATLSICSDHIHSMRLMKWI